MKKKQCTGRAASPAQAAAALAAALILFSAAFSQPAVFALERFSLGAGAETNVITLGDQTMAFGGVASAETRFGPVFALGVNVGAGYGWNDFISIESRVFSRWYFAQMKNAEFFFQADAGVLTTFYTFENAESRGSPSAGMTIGSRIRLPGKWYAEPYIRGGYPFIAGAGILIGYSPFPKTAPPPPPAAAPAPALAGCEGGNPAMRPLDSVAEIAALGIDTCVYFGSNSDRFTGLDAKTIANNYRLLREIVRFLAANPQYHLIIEGHANPVTMNDREESRSLAPLSVRRAELVAAILTHNGIDRRRLVVAGSGGNKTAVPWLDYDNWNLNRRVEFALIKG